MPTYSGIWSLSQQFQGRGQGLWPARPGAPTIGTATVASDTSVSVAFTAPACAGVPATITGYTATSTPGCITGTGASSPITVSGLTTGTAYTFKVKAQNAIGFGACSAASNSVTPAITCTTYTTPGTYSWVAPTGVTKVSAVLVGGGGGSQIAYCACYCTYFRTIGSGGGGGGALAYRNNVTVTPGSSYTVIVGAKGNYPYPNGGASSINWGGCVLTYANGGGGGQNVAGGSGGVPSGTYTNGYAGGAGGASGIPICSLVGGGGGGGAAGYGGKGANGGNVNGAGGNACACTGAAGGGSGGLTCGNPRGGGGGGGVGLFGKGATGTGGAVYGNGGKGGSGGSNGSAASGALSGNGGAYGGGSGGVGYSASPSTVFGGSGAVRIIWPGCSRLFPSTCVGA